jgi:ADP-ribose pyrophosphatase
MTKLTAFAVSSFYIGISGALMFLIYLGAVEPNPAFHNHLCHHWLAEDVYLDQQQDLGDGEMIEVELMSEAQVRAAVVGGELKHALALSALARVYQLWPLPFSHD